MTRNEQQTWEELIEPELRRVGWELESQLRIGPGRINVSGDNMYTPTSMMIVDYVLCYRGIRLAVLEVKAEGRSLDSARLQASQYTDRLMIQFSIAANGDDWILTENQTDEYESLKAPPAPEDILNRMGVEIDWDRWGESFSADYYGDQITRESVRSYQELAISKTLWHFGQGHDRALLVMAPGTGKIFTVFQLIWKMMKGGSLPNQHVLFLTDRNSLKDQAYHAFSGFSEAERLVIDKEIVSRGDHQVGKVFFANYQTMDLALDGRKIYEHFDADFFDLVVIDECHRSGFGDWFGVLEHFASALQLGLTATPRAFEESSRTLSEEERRRDTSHYFGEEIYQYSLKQAVEDGFLVPHFLEKRVTKLGGDGFTGPDGSQLTSLNFERDIRRYDRTKAIAEDLWKVLGTAGLRDEKTIVFCVDDTHAGLMAAELCRLAGDDDYAARITPAERNSHDLERNFALVGSSKPKVAVTVDLLSTGVDVPDVKNIVFVRPLQSSILYQQMKGRGARLSEEVDKRYFTIFDYSGASELEDSEFDGHPVNRKKIPIETKPTSKSKVFLPEPTNQNYSDYGVELTISSTDTNRYVTFADGRRISFEDYSEQSREFIQAFVNKDVNQLLDIWIDKSTRQELRERLIDKNILPAVFQDCQDLWATDDVDILAKIGFDLLRVPTRRQRVDRLWEDDLESLKQSVDRESGIDMIFEFWRAALDHYVLFGIDQLEQARTYTSPEFAVRFGSFQRLTSDYGSVQELKDDLEVVKKHLYVAMAV